MDTRVRASSEHHAGLADAARTLGHPLRLALLEHLAQGERHVERLAFLTGQTAATTSQHLQVLRRGGFVQTRRDGKRILYRLGQGPVLALLTALQHYAGASETDPHPPLSEPICPSLHLEDFLLLLQRDRPVLVDVRPSDEYALGHIPGAFTIPLEELASRLSELPRSRFIVVYCRGPASPLARQAVLILRSQNRDARRLEGGFPQWQAAGLRVVLPCLIS